MTDEQTVAWADEMRVGLHGTVRRVWGRRGTKVVQQVQIVYAWQYRFLAVEVRTGRLWWAWVPSMQAAALAPAVGGLRKHTPVDVVVWDRAPAHRAQRVGAVAPVRIEQPR